MTTASGHAMSRRLWVGAGLALIFTAMVAVTITVIRQRQEAGFVHEIRIPAGITGNGRMAIVAGDRPGGGGWIALLCRPRGRPTVILEETGAVHTVSLSPDGKLLLAWVFDRAQGSVVRLIDLSRGRPRFVKDYPGEAIFTYRPAGGLVSPWAHNGIWLSQSVKRREYVLRVGARPESIRLPAPGLGAGRRYILTWPSASRGAMYMLDDSGTVWERSPTVMRTLGKVSVPASGYWRVTAADDTLFSIAEQVVTRLELGGSKGEDRRSLPACGPIMQVIALGKNTLIFSVRPEEAEDTTFYRFHFESSRLEQLLTVRRSLCPWFWADRSRLWVACSDDANQGTRLLSLPMETP